MARTGPDAPVVRSLGGDIEPRTDGLLAGPDDPQEVPNDEELLAYLPDQTDRAFASAVADRRATPPRRAAAPYVVNRRSAVLHLFPAHEECNLDAVEADDRDYRASATLLDGEAYCGHCFEVD